MNKVIQNAGLSYVPPVTQKTHQTIEDIFSVINPDMDNEEWKERFVSSGIKCKEYDLCIDELGHKGFSNIFTGHLLTKAFCKQAIALAEYKNIWTTDRHENYPTTDVLIGDLGLNAAYESNVLREYIYPAAKHMWNLEGKEWDSENLCSETFLVKYRPEAQAHLSLHHDSSQYTCVVALNEDFEGGGTFFYRQKLVSKGKTGSFTLHPGQITHRHGAKPVTSGIRYVLISFVNPMTEVGNYKVSVKEC